MPDEGQCYGCGWVPRLCKCPKDKQQARREYQAAWELYRKATDPDVKSMLEGAMDGLQSKIAKGPGPEWDAFVETLPGFTEFWEAWKGTVQP